MNSQLHQYPAALYSAVSEEGFRHERFTGEVLRSGRRPSQRPIRKLARTSRLWLSRHWAVARRAPHAHAR